MRCPWGLVLLQGTFAPSLMLATQQFGDENVSTIYRRIKRVFSIMLRGIPVMNQSRCRGSDHVTQRRAHLYKGLATTVYSMVSPLKQVMSSWLCATTATCQVIDAKGIRIVGRS